MRQRRTRVPGLLDQVLRAARHPSTLIPLAYLGIMRRPRLRAAAFRYVDWRDRRRIRRTGFAHLPPATLRFRVHGDLDLYSFLQSGRNCSGDIRTALQSQGKDLQSFSRVLDFGCGCGRTIIWFTEVAKRIEFCGTDIDPAAIAWCREHLPFAAFQVNGATPPLSYADDSFDLIYALSVFTHIDEGLQLQWLRELHRITRPEGLALLSVHGSYYWDGMEPEAVEEIRRKGVVFQAGPEALAGLFPDWYQNAYHSREYVMSTFGKYFQVVAYIPQGLDSGQDLVVLQKR